MVGGKQSHTVSLNEASEFSIYIPWDFQSVGHRPMCGHLHTVMHKIVHVYIV